MGVLVSANLVFDQIFFPLLFYFILDSFDYFILQQILTSMQYCHETSPSVLVLMPLCYHGISEIVDNSSTFISYNSVICSRFP